MSFFHEMIDDSGTMSVNYNYQTILPIEIFLDFEQFSKVCPSHISNIEKYKISK